MWGHYRCIPGQAQLCLVHDLTTEDSQPLPIEIITAPWASFPLGARVTQLGLFIAAGVGLRRSGEVDQHNAEDRYRDQQDLRAVVVGQLVPGDRAAGA